MKLVLFGVVVMVNFDSSIVNEHQPVNKIIHKNPFTG